MDSWPLKRKPWDSKFGIPAFIPPGRYEGKPLQAADRNGAIACQGWSHETNAQAGLAPADEIIATAKSSDCYCEADIECLYFQQEVNMTNDKPPWWERLSFCFDPNLHEAACGEILVGLGNALDTGQPGIVLNCKYPGSPLRSVSGFVLAADAARLTHWRECLPNGMADVQRVVLEDLSLDSCFALLMFVESLARARSEPVSAHTESWRRYVTRWEEGFMREPGPCDESIAFLVTALGHSFFDLDESGQVPIIDPACFAEGACACLELLSAAFAQGSSPDSVDFGKLERLPSFARARGHIEQERSQYRLALQHGKVCQLGVPFAGSERAMVVDALFLEERKPSGLLKTFARNDRENTWTGRGFEVIGLYRPLETGTGGEMTVSLAPESGLSLQALWQELETLENERWGAERPHDHPRAIVSYQDSPHAPNEPWWDDSGKYTLLGAPRSVLVEGRPVPGSKLDWYKDVLPALWKCYSPIPLDQIDKKKIEPSRSAGSSVRKTLWYFRWKRDEQAGRAANSSVANCPTFHAWLKSLGQGIDSPLALPSEASYRILSLDGGFLVLHRDGVSVFDDWTGTPLDIKAIHSVFHDMAGAWQALVRFHANKSLDDALSYHNKLVENPSSFKHHEFEEWKRESWAKRAEVLKAAVSVLNHAEPWPLNEFRALLATLWGFDEQRRETLETIDRIDHVTSEIAGFLRERRSRWIHAVGAGLALGIAAKEVAEVVRIVDVKDPYTWQLELFRKFDPENSFADLETMAHTLHEWEWIAVIALVGGAVLGFVLFWLFGAKPAQH